MVISKLNFTELFAKAWLQALTPANIVAGFRTCGIYPFNRNAISFPDNGSSQANSSNLSNSNGDGSVAQSSTSNSHTSKFTSEQIEIFER